MAYTQWDDYVAAVQAQAPQLTEEVVEAWAYGASDWDVAACVRELAPTLRVTRTREQVLKKPRIDVVAEITSAIGEILEKHTEYQYEDLDQGSDAWYDFKQDCEHYHVEAIVKMWKRKYQEYSGVEAE